MSIRMARCTFSFIPDLGLAALVLLACASGTGCSTMLTIEESVRLDKEKRLDQVRQRYAALTPELVSNFGDYEFRLAARFNSNPDVITEYLRPPEPGFKKIYINAPDKNGLTALHLAASENPSPAVVQRLLDHGADPNARSQNGMTPLHAAILGNTSLDVVSVLIKAGADPNARDSEGWTPLMFACAVTGKDQQIISAMKAAGVNVEDQAAVEAAYRSQNPKSNRHVLRWDAKTVVQNVFRMKTAELLLDAGADPSLKRNDGFTALDMLVEYRATNGTLYARLREATHSP